MADLRIPNPRLRQFNIVVPETGTARGTKVLLDGEDLSQLLSITSVRLTIEPCARAQLSVDVLPCGTTAHGWAEVEWPGIPSFMAACIDAVIDLRRALAPFVAAHKAAGMVDQPYTLPRAYTDAAEVFAATAELRCAPSERVLLNLSEAEVQLIREALDSHEYWQLTAHEARRDGYSQVDDGADPAIDACRALIRKLEPAT